MDVLFSRKPLPKMRRKCMFHVKNNIIYTIFLPKGPKGREFLKLLYNSTQVGWEIKMLYVFLVRQQNLKKKKKKKKRWPFLPQKNCLQNPCSQVTGLLGLLRDFKRCMSFQVVSAMFLASTQNFWGPVLQGCFVVPFGEWILSKMHLCIF